MVHLLELREVRKILVIRVAEDATEDVPGTVILVARGAAKVVLVDVEDLLVLGILVAENVLYSALRTVGRTVKEMDVKLVAAEAARVETAMLGVMADVVELALVVLDAVQDVALDVTDVHQLVTELVKIIVGQMTVRELAAEAAQQTVGLDNVNLLVTALALLIVVLELVQELVVVLVLPIAEQELAQEIVAALALLIAELTNVNLLVMVAAQELVVADVAQLVHKIADLDVLEVVAHHVATTVLEPLHNRRERYVNGRIRKRHYCL